MPGSLLMLQGHANAKKLEVASVEGKGSSDQHAMNDEKVATLK